MQFNAVEKQVEASTLVPRAKVAGGNVRRIMARARYQTPTLASYPIAGCGQSGPLSMIGNH